jgi:hypothetical protein
LTVRVLSPADATLDVVDWRTANPSPPDPPEYNEGWKIEMRGGATGYVVELGDADVIFIDGVESATP